MPAAAIFISYRRDDAAGYARAVGDELARRFGADRVFVDVEDIAAGQAFGTVIESAVGAAEVVLVLIGPRWAGPQAGGARLRLDDPADLVRREVALALAGGRRVIPVLLDGASMPPPATLPVELQGLAARHALELHNTRFGDDMERLVAAVREVLGEPAAPRPRRTLVALLVGAVVATAAGSAWWLLRPAAPGVPQLAGAASAGAAVRPDIDGDWQAEVVYDWPNARFVERFRFAGEGTALRGSASFLGVARGIEAGRIEAGVLAFATRSVEQVGDRPRDTVHRYEARVDGGALRIVMQTEGGTTPHVPVEFIARRVAPAR